MYVYMCMAITAVSHSRRASPTSFLTYTSLLFRYCSSSSSSSSPGTEICSKNKGFGTLIPHSKITEAETMSSLINSNPWEKVLERSLAEKTLTLSDTNMIQTLNLIDDPTKAFRFFKWAQKMGFTHSRQSVFVMLEILGGSRNLDAARDLLLSVEEKFCGSVKLEDRFFNSLIASYGRAGLFHESVKLFKTMKSLGVSPSVITFNILFSILLEGGQTNTVKSLYDEMLRTYGVTPDSFTFNILIRGFCMNHMVDEGFHILEQMEQVQCEPNVTMYNALVDGLCRAGKVDIARDVVKGMSKKSSDLNPNVVTYTTLIGAYCSKQEIDEALRVFTEMDRRGVKPNKITYNTLIKGLCEANKLDCVREFLEGARMLGEFVPDTRTFNTLIRSHCKAGQLDEALKVFAEMSEVKIQRDSATYSVLIRFLCALGNFDMAEELFDELSESGILSRDFGRKPLVAAYNPIFEHLCRNGKTKKAEGVFRLMMRRGTQDPQAYNILIMGHCKEGTYKAAYKLLVLMSRQGFALNAETCMSLISGSLRTGKPLHAMSTLKKMLRSSHFPTASTFHSILAKLMKHGRTKQSANFMKLMLENEIRSNITLSTKLLLQLFHAELGDKALEVLGLLYENGYCVNVGELVGALREDSKLVEACKVLRLILPWEQAIDIGLFNMVISELSKMGKVSEAFHLYYDLVEKGIQDLLISAEDLMTGLEVAGKSALAEFVSKRIPMEEPVKKSGLLYFDDEAQFSKFVDQIAQNDSKWKKR